MRIRKVIVNNYKSFQSNLECELSPKTNVVIGQNNVGKTAFLEAVSLRFVNKAHRNSSFRPEQLPNPITLVEVEFEVSGGEIQDALSQQQGNHFYIPIAKRWESTSTFVEDLKSNRTFIFKALRNGNGGVLPTSAERSIDIDGVAGYREGHFTISCNAADYAVTDGIIAGSRTLAEFMCQILASRIYYFDALRKPAASFLCGTNTVLRNDAENLAEVLNNFQSKNSRYRAYNAMVTKVIPSIKWAAALSFGGQQGAFEVKTSMIDEALGREDLYIPLQECGTGVGQVLAVLYVVANAKNAIIVMDEPNSFLHPGAAKELIKIIVDNTSHQIVLSTHSSEIIAASKADRLVAISLKDERSALRVIDQDDVGDLSFIASELGFSFADLLGYDRILWVEGPTETYCFPILAGELGLSASQLAILPVSSTGDLTARGAKSLVDIYEQMSGVQRLMPSPLAFILDGDMKGNNNVAKLSKAFPGLVRLLPRYTFENYLLDIDCIVDTMSGFTVDGKKIDAQLIHDWIVQHGNEKKYGAAEHAVFSVGWAHAVNTTKFFADLFGGTDTQEEFVKPKHPIKMVDWILANKPTALDELRRDFKEVLSAIPGLLSKA